MELVTKNGENWQTVFVKEIIILVKNVHHINPYKISKDNTPENLITVCPSCHGKEEEHYKSRNIGWTKSEIEYFNKEILKSRINIIEPINISKIEDYIPPKWHLWVYGGYKNPIFSNF